MTLKEAIKCHIVRSVEKKSKRASGFVVNAVLVLARGMLIRGRNSSAPN